MSSSEVQIKTVEFSPSPEPQKTGQTLPTASPNPESQRGPSRDSNPETSDILPVSATIRRFETLQGPKGPKIVLTDPKRDAYPSGMPVKNFEEEYFRRTDAADYRTQLNFGPEADANSANFRGPFGPVRSPVLDEPMVVPPVMSTKEKNGSSKANGHHHDGPKMNGIGHHSHSASLPMNSGTKW